MSCVCICLHCLLSAYASDLLKDIALFLVCMVCCRDHCEDWVADPHPEALNALLPYIVTGKEEMEMPGNSTKGRFLQNPLDPGTKLKNSSVLLPSWCSSCKISSGKPRLTVVKTMCLY